MRFRCVDPRSAGRLRIKLDGRTVLVDPGRTLAVALLEAGFQPFRYTAESGAPRSPLCLMGVCFECLVEVNGQPNVQSCMVRVQDGMTVRRQRGARALGKDE
jgi:predicted molibdopterin-dependent oxidoreductase YjgC